MNGTSATSINHIKIIKQSPRGREFAEIQILFACGQEAAFAHRF